MAGVGDADPHSVAWALYSVKVGDARNITPEVLLDPSLTVMLCITLLLEQIFHCMIQE